MIVFKIKALYTAQRMMLFIKDFFSICNQNPQETEDLVSLTEEIFIGKRHSLCDDNNSTFNDFFDFLN